MLWPTKTSTYTKGTMSQPRIYSVTTLIMTFFRIIINNGSTRGIRRKIQRIKKQLMKNTTKTHKKTKYNVFEEGISSKRYNEGIHVRKSSRTTN